MLEGTILSIPSWCTDMVHPYVVFCSVTLYRQAYLCLHKFGGSWYNPQSADELLFEGKCSKLDELEVFS